MVELHPEFLTKNGKREFVVLPYEDFLALQAWLEDLEDLADLRMAKQEEGDEPALTLAEVKKMFEP